ncbi:nucleoside hydrolase [Skermania piniformis]|uniref:Nucleoside hydrolase n=1 Tax=Skermania pinensis TaxID=39122 RepID=A0ABX8S704_9ACTN|nr:nucleoside hydrolase [Skermania piniformis]QXQ12350.1 nucleoside hydrolase [Skermania piniformis]
MVDVDTGIDDALALLLLLASPEAHILGIASTAGNVTAEQVAANNLALLDLCRARDIEVALGSAAPLATPLQTTEDTHGPRGLGYAGLPRSRRPLSSRTAAQLWIDTARNRPGEVVGLCTGPLTNLALALRAEPALPRLLGRLVVMGGSFDHPGNTTPVAEWNVHVDPEAAQQVFAAFADAPRRPLVCGLNLTESIEMHPSHLARIAATARSQPVEYPTPDDPPGERSAATNPIVRMLSDAVRFYLEFHRDHGQGYLAHMHDPFAAAVALDPSIVELRPATIDVELTGTLTRGMTVVDHAGRWGRPPNVDLAVYTDPDAFFDRLIERVGSYAARVYPPELS